MLLALFAGLMVMTNRRLKAALGTPIAQIEDAIIVVADGQYDTAVPLQDREDEIGAIARTLDTLHGRLLEAQGVEAQREEARTLQAAVVARLAKTMIALADGNLTHQITEDLTGSHDRLRNDYNSAVKRMAPD